MPVTLLLTSSGGACERRWSTKPCAHDAHATGPHLQLVKVALIRLQLGLISIAVGKLMQALEEVAGEPGLQSCHLVLDLSGSTTRSTQGIPGAGQAGAGPVDKLSHLPLVQ